MGKRGQPRDFDQQRPQERAPPAGDPALPFGHPRLELGRNQTGACADLLAALEPLGVIDQRHDRFRQPWSDARNRPQAGHTLVAASEFVEFAFHLVVQLLDLIERPKLEVELATPEILRPCLLDGLGQLLQ